MIVEDAPRTPEAVREGTVLAIGISSAVVERVEPGQGEGQNDDLDLKGHVQLLDLDDVRFDGVLQDFNHRDGYTALLESSPGSYHLWNLSVRDLADHTLDALKTHCEAMHVKQSYRRRRAILRRSPKWVVGDDGRPVDRYKEAPQIRKVATPDVDAPTQSGAHLRLLSVMAEEQGFGGIPDPDDLDYPTVGDTIVRSDYLTFDDATKRRR